MDGACFGARVKSRSGPAPVSYLLARRESGEVEMSSTPDSFLYITRVLRAVIPHTPYRDSFGSASLAEPTLDQRLRHHVPELRLFTNSTDLQFEEINTVGIPFKRTVQTCGWTGWTSWTPTPNQARILTYSNYIE